MFFFRSKQVVLDCFTSMAGVYENAKIDRATNFYPNWWKELPKSGAIDENDMGVKNTMKGCVGFIDYYKSSLVLPMWSDLMVEVGLIGGVDYRWKFALDDCSATPHNPDARGNGFPDYKFSHLKLNSPWLIESSTDLKLLYAEPTWAMSALPTVSVAPGVVNTKVNTSTHMNLFFTRTKEVQKFIIPYNQPIAQIFPLTEKKITLRHHLVSHEEYKKRHDAKHFLGCFSGWLPKTQKAKKCPFSKLSGG